MTAAALRSCALAVALAAGPGCAESAPTTQGPDEDRHPVRDGVSQRVLVFTRTEGFRHDAIPAAVGALREIAAVRGLDVRATEDPAAFHPDSLADVAAVVFLLTSGDVLDGPAERALQTYVEGGGGWLGVHSAADTEYDWAWYGELVGAYFDSHPEVQQTALDVAAADHPATRGLPGRWTRTDEWYNFRAAPSGVTVLLRLDESSYRGGTMGPDHPAAWAHAVGQGRALYTALGHTAESYAEPLFRAHLDGALCWAARLGC